MAKKGKLYYTIKYDEVVLRLITDMQKKLDMYENDVKMLLHTIINPDFLHIPESENEDINFIQKQLIKLKKELIELKQNKSN